MASKIPRLLRVSPTREPKQLRRISDAEIDRVVIS
jgi:hypothetical protein